MTARTPIQRDKREDSNFISLDKAMSLLQQEMQYMKDDVTEVKSDVKEIGKAIGKLSFVTPAQLDTLEKNIAKDYVTKSDFEKLKSKITPLIWFGGIAATTIITAALVAFANFLLSGGLNK